MNLQLKVSSSRKGKGIIRFSLFSLVSNSYLLSSFYRQFLRGKRSLRLTESSEQHESVTDPRCVSFTPEQDLYRCVKRTESIETKDIYLWTLRYWWCCKKSSENLYSFRVIIVKSDHKCFRENNPLIKFYSQEREREGTGQGYATVCDETLIQFVTF